MNREQQLMILLVLAVNTICNLGFAGKVKKIEAETLYELISALAFPLLGFATATMIAYFVKYF